MGRIAQGETIPPFLKKLITLTQNTDTSVASWSSDGKVYNVLNEQKFAEVLKKYFKGTPQTFIRQLHFYGFKKVDTTTPISPTDKENGGSLVPIWGFEHETHLFVRDNSELVKEIRRKTKVDPATQQLASYTEVQALKSQVSYLQHTIEDLRTQLDNVTSVFDNNPNPNAVLENTHGNVKSKSNSDTKSIISNSNNSDRVTGNNGYHKNKRPRKTNLEANTLINKQSSFDKLCTQITPPMRTGRFNYNDIPSLEDIDFDSGSLSDLFSDLDLTDLEDHEASDTEMWTPRKNTQQVSLTGKNKDDIFGISRISEMTKVKESDVEKVLTYLSRMTLNTEHNKPIKKEVNVADERIRMVDFDLAGYRIQKVGAN